MNDTELQGLCTANSKVRISKQHMIMNLLLFSTFNTYLKNLEHHIIRIWGPWRHSEHCLDSGWSDPDLEQAVLRYERATQMENEMHGIVKAKYRLGSMYELVQGGLSQNHQAAFEHYSFAANRMHKKHSGKLRFSAIQAPEQSAAKIGQFIVFN